MKGVDAGGGGINGAGLDTNLIMKKFKVVEEVKDGKARGRRQRKSQRTTGKEAPR